MRGEGLPPNSIHQNPDSLQNSECVPTIQLKHNTQKLRKCYYQKQLFVPQFFQLQKINPQTHIFVVQCGHIQQHVLSAQSSLTIVNRVFWGQALYSYADLFSRVFEGLTKIILVLEMSKNDQYSNYISYFRVKNPETEHHILNINQIQNGSHLFLCLW